jgi:hypothetical protein
MTMPTDSVVWNITTSADGYGAASPDRVRS